MRKKYYLAGLAAMSFCVAGLFSACTDTVIDNPVEPSVVDNGLWDLDENVDESVAPGDNFYVYCNGAWMSSVELPEDEDLYGFLDTEVAAALDELKEQAEHPLIDAFTEHVKKLVEEPGCDVEQGEQLMEEATSLLEECTTREELWDAMAELALRGYQTPLSISILAKSRKPCLIFSVNDGEFSVTEYEDWSSDSYDYQPLLKGIRTGKGHHAKWDKLLRNPRLEEMLLPITGPAPTRGFSQAEWPMLERICQYLEVAPEDVYILDDDLAEDIQTESSLEALEALQAMDFDELGEAIAETVANDELLFGEYAVQAFNTAMMGDGISQYLKYSASYDFSQVCTIDPQHGQEVCEELRQVFRDRLAANSWLGDGSIQNAIDKLNQMKMVTEIPEFLPEGLPDVSESQSLIEDVLTARRSYLQLGKKLLTMDFDDAAYHIMLTIQELSELNAFYIPIFNAFFVLPAWQMEPLYDPEANSAWNYAAYTVFAHEMTHGFDTRGSNYDGKGNRNSLWASPLDLQEFDRRAQQLIDCYNQFEVLPGVYADGEKTVGENIADLGGVEIAFQAYTRHLEKNGFTGDGLRLQQQRFFMAYAHLWQAIYDEDYIMSALEDEDEEHSIFQERINGVVQNMDIWYDLFNVKSGDKLYRSPAERIHIW